MILPDVNAYVYAFHTGSPFHEEAREWLERALVGSEGVAVWDVTLVAVYRLLTNPKLESAISEPSDVIAALNGLRSAPSAIPIAPGERFWSIYTRFAVESDVRGELASDAMLAALALEHRCRIATTDRDFSKFKGIETVQPRP